MQLSVSNLRPKNFRLAWTFYAGRETKHSRFQHIRFGSSRAIRKGVREGKPRIPSGIEGWAGFLPRPYFFSPFFFGLQIKPKLKKRLNAGPRFV
jgi:hypothetical protein